mmetsp:Transcript_1682/g.3932  ORF Transcript_1682/g.3932 Transcript_1682/m.3932 type:complete len:297 (+) Transcript_1682:157-1047(+)
MIFFGLVGRGRYIAGLIGSLFPCPLIGPEALSRFGFFHHGEELLQHAARLMRLRDDAGDLLLRHGSPKADSPALLLLVPPQPCVEALHLGDDVGPAQDDRLPVREAEQAAARGLFAGPLAAPAPGSGPATAPRRRPAAAGALGSLLPRAAGGARRGLPLGRRIAHLLARAPPAEPLRLLSRAVLRGTGARSQASDLGGPRRLRGADPIGQHVSATPSARRCPLLLGGAGSFERRPPGIHPERVGPLPQRARITALGGIAAAAACFSRPLGRVAVARPPLFALNQEACEAAKPRPDG